ncbi:HNH endonuclease signature motif containing protein [Caenibacillus caldisaponilyticus]|uniref:HNH endonuclease signature motif containing protein n=1 Tax=Caenibacillus caldisaponilyticus TaxID=1674942 RepID=UPI0009888C99|nr:HNH endonuclease signature motif containing protein [Caenibacillus caldisaponilyticus]
MPQRPKKPCNHPGCPNLTTERYCDQHKKDERQYDRYRGNSAQRGYDARWRKARLMFLREHPFCVICEQEGRLTPATVVDHIVPHKGNYELFWDVRKWQPLCKQCHDRKTAKEDGGFGRLVRG